ncbi:hypothetical protein EVAR_84540_1 [Eumeta japonica]|uniref:Uncharacterized protein n=1 Tax=Eumeta variegata TaxID=151549 RepID=A0A4C1UHP8_EUMVA|nr:hypothetical protein EVAR_84540_1 [Eumeta japonica]
MEQYVMVESLLEIVVIDGLEHLWLQFRIQDTFMIQDKSRIGKGARIRMESGTATEIEYGIRAENECGDGIRVKIWALTVRATNQQQSAVQLPGQLDLDIKVYITFYRFLGTQNIHPKYKSRSPAAVRLAHLTLESVAERYTKSHLMENEINLAHKRRVRPTYPDAGTTIYMLLDDGNMTRCKICLPKFLTIMIRGR